MTGHGVRRTYVVDQVRVGGQLVPRVREVIPAVRNAGVPGGGKLGHLRKRRTGVVAVVVAVLGGALVALGWAVYLLLALLFGHLWELGVVLALGVLLAGGTGGCTVIVIHKRG